MPTVIDSLVISLGLDPKAFNQGQKKAVQDLKDMEKQAARTANELEARGKQAAQFYSKIRTEVLALGAAFFGARGVEEFTRRMTVADAATGRLASNLGTSVQTLGTWQNAARLAGNSAEDATQSMQNLVSSFEQFALTGQGDFGRVLALLGIQATDATGHLKDLDTLMKEIGQGLAGKSGPEAQALGGMIGLTPGMVNTLRRSNEEMDALLHKAGALAPTPEDVAAAQRLQKAWEGLRLTFDQVGRGVLTQITPQLSDLIDELATFILENKEDIGEGVKHFLEDLKSFPWKQVGTDVKEVATNINAAAQAVGGWVTVGEAFLVLWGGAKMLGIITRIAELAAAIATIGGGSAAAAAAAETAAGGAAAAGAVAAGGAAAAGTGAAAAAGIGAAEVATTGGLAAFLLAMKPSPTNVGEDEYIKAHPEMFPKPPRGSLPLPRPGTAKPKSARKPQPQISGSDVDQLTKMGWSREQAIGILANIQEESHGDIHAVGDKGTAYGLAQWHPDRQAAFKKWAGHDIRQSTREEQLKFINYELRNGGALERGAGARLMNAKSAEESARIVSQYYERPAAGDVAATHRAAIATALSGQYGGSTVTQTANVNINTVNVNAPNATDADSASAEGISKSLKRLSWMPQANQGLT